MSILNTKFNYNGQVITDPISAYRPTQEEAEMIGRIRKDFTNGDLTMNKPRAEFNDMSVLQRDQLDKMSFNSYQSNNGESAEGDMINGWRSRAFRPVVRNKCISIAAHATARIIFPRIFAYNDLNQEDEDAASVMTDLMEWTADKSDYRYLNLGATITALWSPAAIVHTEYAEVYRTVKRTKENGKWKEEKILDEDFSGFQNAVVPVNEFYIENFYQHDVQKQGWLIWRRVLPHSTLREMHKGYKNWQFVPKGMQCLYNDANQSFYEVYDSNMRPEMGEEIRYWNRSLDCFQIMVNGVLLTECDNPNPRIDKRYPFAVFGFELIDEQKCFYYKSLAFKTQQDAKIINTLYPMIIDATYLNMMPPMINAGGEMIASDVIIPGAVTTLSSPDASLKALSTSTNFQAGSDALFKVEQSIDQSSAEQNIFNGRNPKTQTAYEVSKREQEAATLLGLFIEMRAKFVKDFGKLWVSDILQHLTIANVTDIVGDKELVYKTFVVNNKITGGKEKNRRIVFDANLPEQVDGKEKMDMSYGLLKEQGGLDSKTELYKVNPILFRNLAYALSITPDVLNPMSEDLERAFKLEEYDRAIQNPILDQEQVTKDFLLSAYPDSKKDVDKYFKKENPMEMMQQMQPQEQMQPNQLTPTT